MHHRPFLLLLCAVFAGAADQALPLIAPLFGDHAVLQRDRPATVWGWADPGVPVTVVLGDSAAITATAAADGRWQASLPPRAAGGPYTLTATAGTRSTTAKDVLVGDVWLCSGQSNMEFPVAAAKDPAIEKAAANFPHIRHIGIGRLIAGEPQKTHAGTWTVCSPETVSPYTAAGYYFARKLHQDLRIPIGLVNSSYGGTRAECWLSAEALRAMPEFTPQADAFIDLVTRSRAQRESTGQDYDTLVRAWYQANDPGSAGEPATWAAKDADTTDGWSEVTLPNKLKSGAKAVPTDFTGTIWLRRDVDVPAEAAGKPGMLNLIRVKDMNAAWINGRSIGDSESVNWLRKQRVPAGLLTAGRNTVAIRLVCLDGECGLTGAAADLALTPEGQPPLPLAGTWKLRLGTSFATAPPAPVRFDRVPGPTSLYNGMIAPLIPMTITGTLWYQGEANTGEAHSYRTLLPALIRDWRSRFAQGDTPFLIVQLPNHMGRKPKPESSAWAELREAQALTAREVPGGGLAVTIDIGEAGDIHPKNKQDVGLRLALLAESQVYKLPVAGAGPRFRSQTIEGGAIRLAFDATGTLNSGDGGPLTGFAVAGADKRFHWAEARIDGGAILVSAAEVPAPIAVRYAWASNPACNLTDASGLPAAPFRTDEWPGTTWPKPPAR